MCSAPRTSRHCAAPGVARVAGVMLAILGGVVGGKTMLGWVDLTSDAIFTSRSFFGALRVREQEFDTGERYRRLQHGTTLHGLQYLPGEKADGGDDVLHDVERRRTGRWARCRRSDGRHASASSAWASVRWRPTGAAAMPSRSSRSTRRSWPCRPRRRRCSATCATPRPRVEIVGGDARLSLERAGALRASTCWPWTPSAATRCRSTC